MYLRTTRRHNRDGSTVSYYQLAHNVRDATKGTVQAQVIHNFGRADRLERNELVRLCRSIARVCELEVRDPLAVDKPGQEPRPDGVLPAGVTQVGTVAYGPVLAIEALWERLGIGPTLREVARRNRWMKRYERALLAMTANRLCGNPRSKLGVWDRWLETVYLPRCADLKLRQMYEAMDLLHAHAAEVEESVFFETADLLELEVDLVFYDTTTCSFSIDYEDDEHGLRELGYSKEGTWTPQVVVALAVTRQGLPVRSWVFPGSTTDVKTVQLVKEDLRGWKLGRALFVADAGMNSADNRRELLKGCGRYLLAVRAGSVKEVKEQVISRAGRYKVLEESLHVKEVVLGDGEKRRRYILCFNPARATKEKRHRQQVLDELEHELSSHSTTSASAKWAIELRASGRYGRYLKVGKGNRLMIAPAAVRQAERMDGKWVLITNDDTLSVEDAASGYRSMAVIERCFRSLKRTQIQMAPMYHWLPHRIEAHVKICVLALLIQRVAELTVGQPWAVIRRALAQLQVSEYRTETHRFFQVNEVGSEAARILKKLEISPPKPVADVRELGGKP